MSTSLFTFAPGPSGIADAITALGTTLAPFLSSGLTFALSYANGGGAVEIGTFTTATAAAAALAGPALLAASGASLLAWGDLAVVSSSRTFDFTFDATFL